VPAAAGATSLELQGSAAARPAALVPLSAAARTASAAPMIRP